MKAARHSRYLFLLFALTIVSQGTKAQNCIAGFSSYVDTSSQPNIIFLNGTATASSGMITSWQWTYNGVTIGTAPNMAYTHTPDPWDVICLTIQTDSGCQSTWCDTISPCPVSVSFSYVNDSLSTYTFTPILTGSFTMPVTYAWTSSTGTTSSAGTFTTNFPVNGSYTVCLQVADVNGCGASYCDTLNITTGVDCHGCTPHLYYVIDSLYPPGITFIDSTNYIAAPDSDYWIINGNNYGSANSVGITFPAGTLVEACHYVSVAGCSSLCGDSGCITVLSPGISIDHFFPDTQNVFCTAPATVWFNLYGHLYGYAQGHGDTTLGAHITFGDGTDTSFLMVHWQDYFALWLTHVYQNPGSYACQLIVYSPDSVYTDTIISQPVVINNSCGPLTGHAYQDNNGNCVFDTGDVSVGGQAIALSNGAGIYEITYTDASGFYSFNVPTGQAYTLTYLPLASWHMGNFISLCPAGGSMTVNTVPSSNNDFYLECPAGFDLTGSISGWGFVPGRTGSVCVYTNDILGCSPPAGTVQVVFGTLLTPLPGPGYSVNGDTVSWGITQLNGYYQSACIQVTTTATAVPGDSVCVTAYFLPVAGDSVPSNNTITQCWPVRTSWDPNDKTGLPEGAGANHVVLPNTELTYTIRFQNTGTASAQDIYILDELDASLDANTLHILASSHSMQPAVQMGNILRFNFPNINLPDSNTSEPLSHGYLTYSIQPKANVANGTVVRNRADIYFDFNPPVSTNTTSHTIDIFLGVNEPPHPEKLATLYPNPASDKVYVELLKTGHAEFNMYDVAGRMVLQSILDSRGSIGLQALKAGIYTVEVKQQGEVQHAILVLSK